MGPKRTSVVAPHMSAFGGKADMPFCTVPRLSANGPKQTCQKTQSMSLLGVKRTWAGAVQMSAYDPKRTSTPSEVRVKVATICCPSLGGDYEATGIYWSCCL